MKSFKKIITIGIIGLMGAGFLSGCTQQQQNGLTETDVANLINTAISSKNTEIDSLKNQINNLSEELINYQIASETVVETDAEIIADVEEIVEEIVEETGEDKNLFYDIDEVELDGSFEDKIDSDDFEKLKIVDVRFNREDYTAEEVLILTNKIYPIYNIEDMGEDILLYIEENAIEYKIEFTDCVDFSDTDIDDDLEISFLGKDIIISDFDGKELTLYNGKEETVREGESFNFDGKDVIISAITEDGKILINVDGESKTITEGNSRIINGIEIFVKESFDSDNSLGFAVLRLSADEVEYEIKSGDEFDLDDNYDWIIESDDEDNLCSIGIILTEEYTDDDELLTVEDKLCLFNNYLCFSLNVDNDNNDELELTLTSTKLKIDFEGKIEINGKRADDVEIDFDEEIVTYETSSDDKELNLVDAEIYLFNNDREMLFEVSTSTIKFSGYELNFEDGEFDKYSLKEIGFDDEENKRTINGDILYEVDEDYDDVDTVKFGLIDENLETTLKIQ